MQIRPGKKSLFVLCALASFISITACDRKAPGGPPQAGPPEVGVVAVKQEKAVLTTELSGRVSAAMTAEVRPQVGGIIQKRLFTEGSHVKAGEALYQIDPASYKAAYASARAALSKAEANITTVRLKSERYQELVKIKAVSQQEADDTFAALKQAEAEVESAKAALETARINLAYTRITAPVSGIIGRSTVTSGALVTASQTTALATIQQLDQVFVDVTQSSSEMLRIKKNLESGLTKRSNANQAKVKLYFEDNTLYPLTGSLKFSEVTVDQSTGSITLRAVFPNPKQALLPGMFVRTVLEEGVSEQAMLVPQRGVTRNPKGDATVLVVGAEEKVEQRIIKVARTVGDSWLVTDGLKPGDRVILEGLQRARPGTAVKAVPFGSAPPAPAAANNQPAAAKK
jgi:membrane fusion protein, multidrug efflux system